MSKLPLWIYENLHEIIRTLETNYILNYADNSSEEEDMERIIHKLKDAQTDLHFFEDKYSKDNI